MNEQPGVTVRRCERGDYEAMLFMLNTAFGHPPETEWFQKNMGNCVPYPSRVTDDEIAKHVISVCDGKIVGATGVYPMDWVIANARGEQAVLKIYGIGQVSCLPEYRNRGCMTAMLEAAERDMRAQGAVLGFLGGDRWRYGHFGYDFGGNDLQFKLEQWRFKRLYAQIGGEINETGLVMREAVCEDWRELDAAYNTLPSRIVRDQRAWERNFSRYHDLEGNREDHATRWFIGEQNGRKGFLAFKPPTDVFEVYGDPDTVAAMLWSLLETCENHVLTVRYPTHNGQPDAMGAILHHCASFLSNAPLDLMAVIDARGLLAALSPILTGYFDVEGGCFAGLSDAAALALARRLIGFSHRPLPTDNSLAGLENVPPLGVWLSKVDDI